MLDKLIRKSNDLKLRKKLIISYILVVMIPVLIIGSVVIGYFRKEALNNAVRQATNNVEKIKTQMTALLRVPADISNILIFDDEMKKIVGHRYSSVLELTKAYRSYTIFKEYVRQYREISGIRLYADNPTLINNMEFIPLNESLKSSEWYKKTLKARNISWFFVDDGEKPPVKGLSLIRRVPLLDYHSTGLLMIEMDQDQINEMLRQEFFDTYIVDEQGYIVGSKTPEKVGHKLDELDLSIDPDSEDRGAIRTKVHGEDSYVIVDSLKPSASMNGLKVVSVFTTKSIVSGANRVSWIGLTFISLVLLIALIFVSIVSALMTRRLLRLSRQFNRLALGNLDVVSHIDGNDEIGQLSRQFNYMVGSINQLMDQVVEATEQNNKLEIAQREIKLKMMASQINPHFLFNALESIRMNAYLKGEKEIANIVRLLGKMMRKNLEIGREKIALKEEIDMISSYLEIQKFRYEERLNYELNVDPSTYQTLIPPLIIQPLIENSIVHGLENKADGIHVALSIETHENEIIVEIKDNGGGMSSQRLEEVMASITGTEESAATRIGLRNVHQRLIMTFGESAGLNIQSAEGEGTWIRFTLPISE